VSSVPVRLGLRMAVASSGAAKILALFMAVTSAIATVMVLGVLAAIHVHSDEQQRLVARSPYTGSKGSVIEEGYLQPDSWHGIAITRILIAQVGPSPTLPPGLSRVPGPTEAVVSPAVARLVRSDPDMRLRFAGRTLSTLHASGLVNPDELIAYEGASVAELKALHAQPIVGYGNASTVALTTRALTANAILVFLGFIVAPFAGVCAIVSRLANLARQRRLTALRIMGVSQADIRTIAAVEGTLASSVGAIAGFAAFWALRPVFGHLRIGGSRHFVSDITVAPYFTALVLFALPTVGFISARVTARHVSALPVSPRPTVAPKPIHRRTLIAFPFAGLAFGVAAVLARTSQGPGVVKLLDVAAISAVVALAVGFPSLMQVMAGLSARLRRLSPVGLLVARRLQADPGAVTRLCSLFATMVFFIGFAIGLQAAFRFSDSSARHDLTYGDRSVATVGSSFLPLAVTALQSADPSASVIAARSVTGPHGDVGTILTGTCSQLQRLSTTTIACPDEPVVLDTPASGTTSPSGLSGGDKIVVPDIGAPGAPAEQPLHLDWPIGSLRIGASPADQLDGVAWLPTNSPASRQLASRAASSAVVISAPTPQARDAVRAAVASTSPWATVEYPGEDEILSDKNYASYGTTVLLSAAMACIVGLTGLFAAGFDSVRQRSRTLASLHAVGLSRSSLTRAATIEVAIPLATAVVTALIAGYVGANTYLTNDNLPTPIHGFVLLGAASLAIAASLAVTLAVAASYSTAPKSLRSE
jgi:hypothetical protein